MLVGDKIVLRPIEMKDLPYLNKWKNDYDVFKNLGGGFNPISIDQQKKWMESLIDMQGNTKRFIIETKVREVIGMIGLYNINFINRNCEFGIYIGEKDQHGNGYGSEATKLMLDFAYYNLNLKKIKLLVNENNPAIKMYERLGFKSIGKMQEERFVNGGYINVVMMERLKGECDKQ